MRFKTRHAALAALLSATAAQAANDDEPNIARNPIDVDPAAYLERISLPEGFAIEIYANEVEGARSMALAAGGTLFVGTLTDANWERRDTVYAIAPPTSDAEPAVARPLLTGLNVPNGLALRDGDLYVAEVNRVVRFDDIEQQLDAPPEPVVLNDSFPDELHHGWKYLRFGPDDRLYVSVGAPCNTCEVDEGQGIIASLALDGSDKQVYAKGVRNSVGFDFHPQTGELWFTDNGRDMWGDDRPPEELNHAPRPGMHFGFPHRYGADLVDTDYPTERPASDFTAPALAFPAHNALLGMRFNTGEQFPEAYRDRLFIASHGSWNRSVPDGYRIYSVRFENGQAVDYEIFADGWLTPEHDYWGRPVDIEWLPDGSMLVSDDHADVIYRIFYAG